jgi:hypothetical protein
MRKLLIGGALAALALTLTACGGSSASSASQQALQREADLHAIDQIEQKFHQAISRDDINQMMSLWASNATFTVGPGQTLTEKQQIRRFFLTKSKLFDPKYPWVSETPAYKIRSTANGDKGTLYFECHFIDLKTEKLAAVTGADMNVARINGRWLISSMVGSTPTLSP